MNVTVTAAFPPYATAIIALLAAAVSIATQVGNLVVLTAFLVESSLRIPSNYFIASLAVTDVLIGLLSMNLFITYQLLGYWPLGQFLCDVWLSLDFSACLTSQYTVFLITLDRYCSVKIPASYRNWRTLAKVRIMICVSWLFPAGLFTPVIFGWKQMTSEPPRSEGKCDVSFTYYPIFNTTLILCYFWTTLVVMCSLYVGIYRVAKRLQRRNQSAGKKLAALFAMGDQNPEEYEDGEEERERAKSKFSATKEMKRTNKEKLQLPVSSTQGSWMGNDSGFRDFPSGTDDPVSEAESVKMVTRYRLSGSEPNEFSWSDGENHKIFLPLKTSEEQFDLRQVRSPEGVNTEGIIFSESANHTHDTDGTIEENEADIKPPSRIELVDCLSITKYSDSNGRKPSSQLHPERRKVLRDFPEPFYCECDQSAVKQYNPQLTDNYEADSPGSSSPLSLVPVHLFVPSPTVPISGAQGSILQPKTTADPCCNPSVNDSPVWIENHMSKQTPTKKFYYCPECYQIIGPSFVSYDSAQPYRSADEENSCPISPSKVCIH
ncbi:putative muscarinic acetylcholine receptor gar-2 [Fasciola hepatica]|uniref:Muscarinic acetylcholine receptor gar-2 n=1 Tax=Fasciola hepatica TaxID=6192 RepID=A0A4E0RHW0_FASHE|nr:putative muscarinic acetylcholine receptor gar-2 [Fasciola hepatica]